MSYANINYYCDYYSTTTIPSVLLHCWLNDRKYSASSL